MHFFSGAGAGRIAKLWADVPSETNGARRSRRGGPMVPREITVIRLSVKSSVRRVDGRPSLPPRQTPLSTALRPVPASLKEDPNRESTTRVMMP